MRGASAEQNQTKTKNRTGSQNVALTKFANDYSAYFKIDITEEVRVRYTKKSDSLFIHIYIYMCIYAKCKHRQTSDDVSEFHFSQIPHAMPMYKS